MRAQRAWEGESQAEMQTAKWTAEGTVNERPELVGMDFQTRSKAPECISGGFKMTALVLCDVGAYVSCRRYVGISLSARSNP